MALTNPSAAGGIPYRVPPEPSKVPSIILAVVVHAGLLLFLWSGIRWQNTEPIAVEAEVWDMNIKAAAAPPEPTPEPVRAPEPEPVKRAPPVVEQPVPPKAPDIALERLKEQKQKKLLEKKLAEEKLAEEQEKKKLAEEKELAEKKAAEKAEKLAKAKQEAKELATIKKMRDADLKRQMGALGDGGEAAKSSGPKGDPSYYAAIAAKIRSNLSYAGSTDVPGDPVAEFQIDQLPTGEIMSARMTKSSGIPAYDDAIKSAIALSSPLPKKKDGTVQKSVPAAFRLKEKR